MDPSMYMTPTEFNAKLEQFRQFCPCSLVGGFRTPLRNAQVRGAASSLHLLACAADLVFDSEGELFNGARTAQQMFGGVELDLTNYHLHVDGRKNKWQMVRRAKNTYTDLSEYFLTNPLL